ncbi:MAG: deoxyribodipyrimidine photo-lyase [Burkholderiaceae bacterium]
MPPQQPELQRGLVWFRRDLRVDDQAALYHALRTCRQVWCLFVFDTEILDPLLRRGLTHDRRVEFIHASVVELSDALRDASGNRAARLIVRHGRARDIVPRLAAELAVDAVFVNHDHEPAAIERDRAVADALERDGRTLRDFKDQTLFERDEILTQSGTPFSVFTPYKRAWLKAVTPFHVSAYQVTRHAAHLAAVPSTIDHPVPTLAAMGFSKTNLADIDIPTGASGAHRLFAQFEDRIGDYATARDYPATRGTSYLSVHLRFGTISIRALARAAIDRARHAAESRGADTWLSELIWRDFYFQILHHRPDVAAGAAFKPQFDRIAWQAGRRGDELFDAWCAGRTGYPLVDAAMTQINTTGFMHNRLRMVTASFLSKDLGLDWRRGERYFAERLNDFDLSANNGGWQWASSSGCDAQPWFRIFNPVTQSERFDPDGAFIRRYLPALAKLSNTAIHAPWLASPAELQRASVTLGRDYPLPVVDHADARSTTLARYAVVKQVD